VAEELVVDGAYELLVLRRLVGLTVYRSSFIVCLLEAG